MENSNIPNTNLIPPSPEINIQNLKPFPRFCMSIGAIPTSYMYSLTYEEQLLWLCKFLQDTVIPAVNNNGQAVAELQALYIQLKDFVDNYFTNLDVQQEINNKLDEMVEDGTLQSILNQFFTQTTGLTFSTFQELKAFEELAVGNKCKTFGFYSVNDGGEGFYYITNVEDTSIPQIKINDTLFANLIFSNEVNVKALGTYGDNSHDDTLILQSILDLGFNVYFPKGNYLVSKNENLNFENNDEPCLAIQTKNNMSLTGNNATLISNVHAQGILEIINSSNIEVNNLKLKSIGVFPSLDGTTGRGEKGNETEGYYTVNFWGNYKNNSYDTSNFTTHASINNGQAWGKFQNGFIGNVGSGILIHNNCDYVTIKNCEIYGFNYASIQIGFRGDSQTTLPSKNIKCINNKLHDNYSAGIDIVACEDYTIENNTIFNIGHPNALYTDLNCDPGYGISHSAFNVDPKKGIILSNHIYNVKRKGIDLHCGQNIIISNNIIDNALVCGIYAFANANNTLTHDITIVNNQILNSSYCTGLLPAITTGGKIDVTSSDDLQKNITISQNLIKNCGADFNGLISCRCGENIIVSNNILKDINKLNTPNCYAIVIGRTSQYTSKFVNITNNILDLNNEKVSGGIFAYNCETGVITANIINIPSSSLIGTSESNIAVFGNYNSSNQLMGNSQQGLSLPYLQNTNNIKSTQIASYLNTLYFKDSNGNLNYIPKMINLKITANGTENPTYVVNQGSEFIDSVVSNERGVQINLKNLSNKIAVSYSIDSSNGLTTGSVTADFMYLRTVTNTNVIIGLKQNSLQATPHIPIANCTSGSLNVTIFA